MSFHIDHDFFDNPIVPSYILCKANKERIGTIKCTQKKHSIKFNSLDEINFTTYLYNDDEKNIYYDAIDVIKYILLPDIGFFAITSVKINSEGTRLENKEVTAQSYECLLGQKYLETFTINMGTVESIDGVRFYNIGNPEKSLLHLVLEKCPDWTIGHVDTSLQTMERSFEVTKQDVYSFMTTDISEAFECIFLFDTLTNTINVYQEKNVGTNTDIYVSYNNLLKSTNITCNIDNIKTCLTLTGADDLNVREINMGFDKIYNLEYYNSTEYMSSGLYTAYNKWIKKRNDSMATYTTLLSQYENYYVQINELTNLKMPSNPDSTNWAEYGLVPLQEKLAAYEQQQAVMMKAGWGNPEHANYSSKYKPIYNTIENINTQLTKIKSELTKLNNNRNSVYSQMSAIINNVSMTNNFTSSELKELTTFIREDELSTSNFVVTENMTDEERFEMLHAFLDYGEKELAKVALPQLSFETDMVNLFAIPEFQRFNGVLDVGNYIHISLRDDLLVKTRLLTMDINYLDVTDFQVTFGNIAKSSTEDILADITDAIKLAQSAASSVSFNSSYWNKASKETSDIGKMIEEGLLSQGKYLKSGDDSEMILDKRGMFVNTTSGNYANEDSIFIGGGRILFTEDAWKTVAMSVGRADVTIKGIKSSHFGTFADFVLAGYIGGSTIEGDEIIGGTITGTDFNNGNGTFHVDSYGNLTATSADVKGTIKADAGYIGGDKGFTIVSQKLYSGKDALTNAANGVYLGTDGIALGANSVFTVDANGNLTATSATITGTIKADKGYIGGDKGFKIDSQKLYNNGKDSLSNTANGVYIGTDGIALGSKFKVDSEGNLTATSGTIGGVNIRNDGLNASNDNWRINSDGSATFRDIFITGVKNDSNFGSVGYKDGITFGKFGGDSYFGSNVGSPFSGTCVTHIQSISADYIKANYLDAINANIDNLWAETANINNLVATKASIESLNAATARISTIESNYITAKDITVANLKTGTVNGYGVSWDKHQFVTSVSLKQMTVVTSAALGTSETVYVVDKVDYSWYYFLGGKV